MMFTIANWCSVVAQGTIQSWVLLGFPYLAIRPMANAGEGPKFFHWGHAGPLTGSLRVLCLGVGKGLHSGSGAASCGCWPATVYVGSSDELVRRAGCGGGISPHCGRARGRCEVIARITRRDRIRPGGFVFESMAVRFAVICWAAYPLP